MIRLLKAFLSTFIVLVFSATLALGQSGKVTGTVTDAETGSPLPGVNVVIEGEQIGATTDAEGNYTILNVSPGMYTIRATFVGYADAVYEGIDVNIDLTSEVNFEMQEQTQALDEVVVKAQEPIVKPDVSANVANISSTDIENMPVTSVTDVVSLQAGFEGLRVRGSDLGELQIQVDGLSMRDGRTNAPFAAISYTAVDEVQVQTGGFNAEYGNLRSGLINVVTKEGPRDRYTVDVLTRYQAPQKKWRSGMPTDADGYYMRPYLPNPDIPDDKDPAFVGTQASAWDEYTRRQYPEFEGWNTVAEAVRLDDNGVDNFTPEDAIKAFKWSTHQVGPPEASKPLIPQVPDYTVDASFGGPVPVVSDALGDLRFFASVRQTQEAYPIPQIRQAQQDKTASVKLTSNITPSMKLMVQGLYNESLGLNETWDGGTNMLMANDLFSHLGWYQIFGDSDWAPMMINRYRIGGELTHTLSSSTFYNLRFQRMYSDWNVTAPAQRNLEVLDHAGDLPLDEDPLGWEWRTDDTIWGAATGAHMGKSRDSSETALWRVDFDITSQLNRFIQLKAGADGIYNNYKIDRGRVDSFFVHHTNPYYEWSRTPVQGAAYVQNKLEFEGMIANVGVRFDYFDAGGSWYDYETFDEAFSPKYGFDEFEQATGEKDLPPTMKISPRLGVSFPVTANSKLYFNYGHFAQTLNPDNLFQLREINTGAVDRIGNPSHPFPTTVAYELGYEHNLFNKFLLRVTGYYKALGNQERGVNFEDITGQTDYVTFFPWNYEDIRGAEFTLRKNSGWVRGFINYTYMVSKGGNFGYGRVYENPFEMRNYLRGNWYSFQWNPSPEPFARMNLEFLVPRDLGPSLGGVHPLGDWRISFLGSWRRSAPWTYTGQATIPRLKDNVKWTDAWSLDMRLNRNINVGAADLQLFADVTNVLNIRRLAHWASFHGPTDWRDYMESLHLPEGTFQPEDVEEKIDPPHLYVFGDDMPGVYREPGVEFQPIEAIDNLENVKEPYSRPYYWEKESGEYFKWNGNDWVKADDQKIEEVIKNKAYIDMPNLKFARFLNPRRVQFGVRFTF